MASKPPKIPARLLPHERLLKTWREAARHLKVDSPAYVRRWTKFWTGCILELQKQQTWEDRDVRLLEEFVEWTRKADFHATLAGAAPYQVHESGRTFAHPGFRLEQDARREARVVAEKLLLGETSAPDAGDGEDDGPPAKR
jgi:hypothetical protein